MQPAVRSAKQHQRLRAGGAARPLVIAVTGTPGTGKTLLLKALRKQGWRCHELNALAIRERLYDRYDPSSKTHDVDIPLLALYVEQRLLTQQRDAGVPLVLASHLSHHLPSRLVDLCVVLRCSIPVLKQRLARRGYPAKKLRENLDAEIFDTILVEALDAGHRVLPLDTSETSPQLLVQRIIKDVRLIRQDRQTLVRRR